AASGRLPSHKVEPAREARSLAGFAVSLRLAGGPGRELLTSPFVKRAWIILLALAALASSGGADDATTAPTSDELDGLCKKALAAAVASTTKTTYALDDGGARCDGGQVKPEELAQALRAAAEKTNVKLIKHEANLEAPMLRAHLCSLSLVTARDAQVD